MLHACGSPWCRARRYCVNVDGLGKISIFLKDLGRGKYYQ